MFHEFIVDKGVHPRDELTRCAPPGQVVLPKDVFNQFSAIRLEEMAAIRLMNRVDKKYVVPASMLPEILGAMSPHYFMQLIKGKWSATYSTTYYDTPAQTFYRQHVNGHLNRHKVRIRNYLDTKTSFLEIKSKTNKGRTIKHRIPVIPNNWLEPMDRDFIGLYMDAAIVQNIKPFLGNRFQRITLASKRMDERITIDTGLEFYDFQSDEVLSYGLPAIIEIKQDRSAVSPMTLHLRHLRVKSSGLSKYCLGMNLLKTDIKYNNYKAKLRQLKKQFYDSTIFG
ncbi:polyphosphate polymerase domain-containing protein [Geofilum rhodophaeum]|uniref:polyphosphate polymerase domain-containing protein n=1 Tax=Geofilum rhodophaeum TaxID=1965019 RepID=UPI000B52658C|nr:polyphosphate polymerase domain-containing protein [Geofilum rhodophaeum]